MPQADAVRIPGDLAARLVDPAAWADVDGIHRAFSWLRANNPLGVAEVEGFDPFWVATRHADILEISRQNDLFHSGDRPAVVMDRAAARQFTARCDAPPVHRSIVGMDAPEHPRYRLLTQAWFAPVNVRKREARIRVMARASVERMLARMQDGRGECDFVRDVALHYPLHVIMDILGVPEADEPLMLKLTQEVFGSADPDIGRNRETTGSASLGPDDVFREFNRYFAAIVEERRRRPADDVATVLATGEIDGRPPPEIELLSYYVTIATAGHDTTSSSTAGALQALAEDPALLARVKADPALIPGLVDEAIRWTTPVQHFMRTATADYELRGRTIRQGDWVMLCYPSGNRDEAVFEDPFAFRIDRSPNRQLAFGYGAHVCLGQHLARLEMRLLFEELLPRIRTLELAGVPKRTQAVFVGGLKTLPVRFEGE